MAKRATGLTDAEVGALIRERRAALDARLAAGEVATAKPVTYSKPRGPLISGGPHGWRKADLEA